MLALARGLMAGPRLLMLDEPSLGLAPLAVQGVFTMIQGLRERGITILLVEQNVRQALAIADRGYVMEGGKIIIEGAADALLNHDHLLNAFFGLTKEETI
jgi:branched-chain amino acid transport system ATP-binding protein